MFVSVSEITRNAVNSRHAPGGKSLTSNWPREGGLVEELRLVTRKHCAATYELLTASQHLSVNFTRFLVANIASLLLRSLVGLGSITLP